MDDVFNKDFWINIWENDTNNDTYNVHRGFSTAEYWDKTSSTYNKNKGELATKKLEKTIDFFKRKNLLFEGMSVLDVGCGTGALAIELAKHGAFVTAIDFSKGMLDRFQDELPENLEDNIDIIHADWQKLDIGKLEWNKNFDLVIAFMSPAVATPESFFKLMSLSKNGCAMKGWSAKRKHPIIDELWSRIMNRKLEDKPQSIFYKVNLLFSLGYSPDIMFDQVKWDQKVTLEEEYQSVLAFFKEASDMPEEGLGKIIKEYLESIANDNIITRKHKGSTATAIWNLKD